MLIDNRNKKIGELTIIRKEFGYKNVFGIGIDMNGNCFFSDDWSKLVKKAIPNKTRIIELEPVQNAFSAPRKVFFDSSHSCYLKCPFCLSRSDRKEPRNGVLSDEQIDIMLNEIVRLGTLKVKIGGGEPLLLEKLPQYCDFLVGNGIYTSLSTSGYFGSRSDLNELIGCFKRNRIKVSVSIDGTERTHDAQRGVVGVYQQAVKFIKMLKANDCQVEIRATIIKSPTAIEDISHVANLAKLLDVFTRIRFAKPVGSSYDNKNAFIYPDLEYWSVFRLLRELSHEKDLFSLDEIIMYDTESGNISLPCKMDCAAGTRSMYIDQVGNVSPCGFVSDYFHGEDFFPNNKNLINIWRYSEGFLQVRDYISKVNLEHECSKCQYVHACQGGCPLIRFRANETKDPRCPTERNMYKFADEFPVSVSCGSITRTSDQRLVLVGEVADDKLLLGTPGGRLDGVKDGNSLLNTIYREIFEELGVLESEVILNRRDLTTNLINVCYDSRIDFSKLDFEDIISPTYLIAALLIEYLDKHTFVGVFDIQLKKTEIQPRDKVTVIRIPSQDLACLDDTTLRDLENRKGITIQVPDERWLDLPIICIGTLKWLKDSNYILSPEVRQRSEKIRNSCYSFDGEAENGKKS